MAHKKRNDIAATAFLIAMVYSRPRWSSADGAGDGAAGAAEGVLDVGEAVDVHDLEQQAIDVGLDATRRFWRALRPR